MNVRKEDLIYVGIDLHKVVCSESCQQLASESLVEVIASELRSKHPVLLGDRLY